MRWFHIKFSLLLYIRGVKDKFKEKHYMVNQVMSYRKVGMDTEYCVMEVYLINIGIESTANKDWCS